MATTPQTKPLIFRKGLDMKEAVAGELAAAYHSGIVEDVRANDFQYRAGRLTVHLAREFGFCYGVDRAVDYAYQARRRFPEQSVYLTGEIIHNPHVNDRLRAAGIRFLSESAERWDALGPKDVVILPAFGVTVGDMARLADQGCTLVDTTCGSVLNVWKNVVRYAQEGYTAVIHGKIKHEETRATASQALKYPQGRFLVVLDRDRSADRLRLRADRGGRAADFLARFGDAASPGFDPDRDLERIGCANQTTMLMSESLEIGEMVRAAMTDRYGEAELAHHFRAFDTICSATQERQDAVLALLDDQRSAEPAARPDDRRRGLQQQQHLQPRADLRRARADLPHRRPRLPGVCRRGAAPSGRRAVDDGQPGAGVARLASGLRSTHRRPHGRRLDAQQHRRRSHRTAGPLRVVASCHTFVSKPTGCEIRKAS